MGAGTFTTGTGGITGAGGGPILCVGITGTTGFCTPPIVGTGTGATVGIGGTGATVVSVEGSAKANPADGVTIPATNAITAKRRQSNLFIDLTSIQSDHVKEQAAFSEAAFTLASTMEVLCIICSFQQ